MVHNLLQTKNRNTNHILKREIISVGPMIPFEIRMCLWELLVLQGIIDALYFFSPILSINLYKVLAGHLGKDTSVSY